MVVSVISRLNLAGLRPGSLFNGITFRLQMSTLIDYNGGTALLRYGTAIFRSDDMRVMSAICSAGFGAVTDMCVSGQSVQDAVAPPPVRPSFYRVAPAVAPLKQHRAVRRSGGGGSGGDDDGGMDGGGSYGANGGSGDSNGGWGNNWGNNWQDGWNQWNGRGDSFTLLYHVVCWMSFSRCLYHVLKVSTGGTRLLEDVQVKAGASPVFAQCFSVFSAHSDPQSTLAQ